MPLTVTSFSSRVESTSGGAATGDPATDGAATADGTPISAAIVTAVAARRTRCIAPPDSRQRPSHGQPLAYPPSDEPGQRVHGAGRPVDPCRSWRPPPAVGSRPNQPIATLRRPSPLVTRHMHETTTLLSGICLNQAGALGFH